MSDSRNHLLDDPAARRHHRQRGAVHRRGAGAVRGIVALTQLSENLHHANLRLWFEHWGERCTWISPRFHRLHHAVGVGHESLAPAGPGTGSMALGGRNFGVLLPWWDMLFGTANFEHRYEPTGVRDRSAGAGGRRLRPGAAGRSNGAACCAWRGVAERAAALCLRVWGHS